MGPPRAADVIREGMFRGTDGGVLLTDRKFAGADTLATSYAISCAIRKMNPDIIVAGRQAIDGDTAQVGPQVAEKLGWPQVTYAEEIKGFEGGELVIVRRLESGVETVSCPLPMVVTVNGSAAECRPRHAKLLMRDKHAKTVTEEQENADETYMQLRKERDLVIPEWGVADVEADPEQCGLSGSPTKVKKIENIVFAAKGAKRYTASEADMNELMSELIANHTIG
jgi:electron transfer flavoprotein beta subunit